MRVLAFLCVMFAAPSSEVQASPAPAPAALQAQACGLPTNPNFVMYNRCAWAHIGDQGGMFSCHPPAVTPGVFVLDAADKKASYRFTLSPTLIAAQNPLGVWLYYETLGGQRIYEVSLRTDVNGRPGSSLGRTKFATLPATGGPAWQYVPLKSVQYLTPGTVYHLRISASLSTVVDPSNCIALVTARSKCPIPYVATDGQGTAVKSPFDPALAVMMSPGAPNVSDFLVQGDFAVGLSPIFALDLGPSGLVGQPFDSHVETTISRRNQFGQAITIDSTQIINYASFFVRGMGCPPSEGCPPTNPNCQSSDLPRPFGALKLVITCPGNPQFQPVVATMLPANYTEPVYLKRSHWFGVTLPDVVLTPGTYHFLLKSSESFGIDPVTDHDGWTFSVEGSTLPVAAAAIPTYLREKSYAIQSDDSGATVQPFDNGSPGGAKKWDTGFILGYFPGGLNTPLAILDDAVVVAHCSGNYALTVPLGTRVLFNETNRNIGAVDAFGPNRIFLRVLDSACNVLNGPADGGGGLPIAPNRERNNAPGSLSIRTGFNGSADAFVWVEVGHYEGTTMVRDDLIPYEVRVGPCP
ncbi:MAG: hypothetical protein ACKVXR_01640 [Planctomycetota bacterium]